MKKGFTLAELLTVVVIIGVLASLALPVFTKTVEQSRADQAATYLRLVRSAEKVYYASNGNYTAATDAAAIRTNLGVELTTEGFGFAVTTGGGGSTFTATATRNSGPCATKTIQLSDNGTWSGTYNTTPACQNYFNAILK